MIPWNGRSRSRGFRAHDRLDFTIFVPPIKEVHYFGHLHSPIKLLDTNGRVEALKTYILWISPELHLELLRQNLHWFDMYLDEPINDA